MKIIKCPRRIYSMFTLLVLFLIFVSPVNSQTIKGAYSLKRETKQTQKLLRLLKNPETINKVPEHFFGKDAVYDRVLADLVIFIDKSGSQITNNQNCPIKDRAVNIALLKKGKHIEKLFGEKFVYAMVFIAENVDDPNSVAKPILDKETLETEVDKLLASDSKNYSRELSKDINRSSEKDAIVKDRKSSHKDDATSYKETSNEITANIKQREPISVSNSSLDSTPGSGEFIFYSVIRSVADIFTGSQLEKPDKPEKAADIINVPLKMYEVGTAGNIRLFFGFRKIPLSENTINRITITEEIENTKNLYLATFGNYSNSLITSSIGLIGTMRRNLDKEKDSPLPVDVFIFANIYLKRPQLPAPRYQSHFFRSYLNKLSLSLVAGTKLSNTSLFDDLFFGISLGHIVSNLGFAIGVNLKATTIPVGESTRIERKPHFSCGFIFIL